MDGRATSENYGLRFITLCNRERKLWRFLPGGNLTETEACLLNQANLQFGEHKDGSTKIFPP